MSDQTSLQEGLFVADESDRATAAEMQFAAVALEEIRRQAAPEHHPDFDGESCVSCGSSIPALRLEMGRVRCVACQERLERQKQLSAR
jgi:RNA polymerase-binding transcription factor DksA